MALEPRHFARLQDLPPLELAGCYRFRAGIAQDWVSNMHGAPVLEMVRYSAADPVDALVVEGVWGEILEHSHMFITR